MKLVALAFASLIGFSGIARADDAPMQTPTPYDGPPGAMSAPEQLGAPADYRPRPPRGQRVRRGQGQGAPLRAAIVARFDRDGDGRLSPQERRHAARALRRLARKMARQERRGAGGGGGAGQPRVDVDVNW